MRLVVLVLPLALLGCSGNTLGVADVEACADEYSVPAVTQLGARHAYGLCQQLFNPATTPARRAFAECALPKLRDAGSDLGVRVVASTCSPKA